MQTAARIHDRWADEREPPRHRDRSAEPPLLAAGNQALLRALSVPATDAQSRFRPLAAPMLARQTPPATEPAAPAEPALTADQVTVTWGADADQSAVTDAVLNVVKDVAAKAGVSSFTISSTVRDAEAQARAMFTNIEAKGAESQKALYGPSGDKVIDVYTASKAANKSADEIKADMKAKIDELGVKKVSDHGGDPTTLAVIDVMPSTIDDEREAKFKELARGDARVTKFLEPPNDPAFHFEIPPASAAPPAPAAPEAAPAAPGAEPGGAR